MSCFRSVLTSRCRQVMGFSVLLMHAKTLIACTDRNCCSRNRLPCLLQAKHSSEVDHSCRTGHQCPKFCRYCESRAAKGSLVGGQDGDHDCGDASHSCNQIWSLSWLKTVCVKKKAPSSPKDIQKEKQYVGMNARLLQGYLNSCSKR